MAKIPEKIRQIAITHAPLINSVVMTCQNSTLITLLEPELIKAHQNGWEELVKRIRKILAGSRKQNLLKGLDEEDAGIILAILIGLQNPEAVKNLNKAKKAEHAPLAIAKLIQECHKNSKQMSKELEHILLTMRQTNKNEILKIVEAIELLVKKDYQLLENSLLPGMDEINKEFINKIRKEIDE